MKRAITIWAWQAPMLSIGAALGIALGAPISAVAQSEQSASPTPRVSEVGHSTRAWLELQSSNTQAAPAQPMLGAEAGLAYRRYMASFNSKIPDLYGSTLSSSGGSGGGSSGSSGGGSGGMPGGAGGGGY